MSTQQPMQNYSFDQSEADTALFFLHESGYSDPVVIGAADTDAYVAATVISQQLPSVLCSCMTGCDANSGFYGKGKTSVYDQVAKSPVARRQLSWCGEDHDLDEEVVEHNMSPTATTRVAEAHAAKWKTIKNK